MLFGPWGGGQLPSRGPPRCGISRNAYQIRHHENNHCYSHWMCSAWEVGQTIPFSGRGSTNAAKDDPRPSIIQLNTEGSLKTRSPSLSS